jgi:pimeloyl-ACP methyl ester carboxylesterase
VPHLWPLGKQWIDEQVAAGERGEPVVVRQPRSYDWEDDGPPTVNPDFAGTTMGQFLGTLNNELRNQEALVKMHRVLTNWDLRPRYAEMAQLDVPTLVIVGGNEPQKTIELSYEWHQQYKVAEFFILPDAHHGATLEDPVGWNKAVHGFLQRHGI